MTNYSAGYGTRLCDDEELGHVDYACKESGLDEGMSAWHSAYTSCTKSVTRHTKKDDLDGIRTRTIIIITHRLIGTSVQVGNVSTNGMTYSNMKAASGAWLKSNCMLFIWSFL